MCINNSSKKPEAIHTGKFRRVYFSLKLNGNWNEKNNNEKVPK